MSNERQSEIADKIIGALSGALEDYLGRKPAELDFKRTLIEFDPVEYSQKVYYDDNLIGYIEARLMSYEVSIKFEKA